MLRFISYFTTLVINNYLWGVWGDIGGGNCAFFGCPTSRKHKISLFRVLSIRAFDGEHRKEIKLKARKECLRFVLRTCELTPELKKRIEANNIVICERHFKSECILTGRCFLTCSTVVYCVILNAKTIYIHGAISWIFYFWCILK